MITQDEFNEWLMHPVTRKLKNDLEDQIEEVKVGLLNDTYEDPRKARGMAVAYQNIVDLDYEGLVK